jgi:hypothetical protein
MAIYKTIEYWIISLYTIAGTTLIGYNISTGFSNVTASMINNGDVTNFNTNH